MLMGRSGQVLYFHIGGGDLALQKYGENQLRIEVATTLGREMAKYPNAFGQIQESAARSGITDEADTKMRVSEQYNSIDEG